MNPDGITGHGHLQPGRFAHTHSHRSQPDESSPGASQVGENKPKPGKYLSMHHSI